MYCVNCGVKLADSEKKCPLCNTAVYHPDIKREDAPPPYPTKGAIAETVNPIGLLFVITFLFIQPILITLFCDLQINYAITWSAYAAGGILLAYIVFILPYWFKKPNPVIFTPINFVSTGLFLLYINYATDSSWFMTFAFPILGYAALLTCTVVTLCRYLRKGYLYVFGGSFLALAIFFVLIEMFAGITFRGGIRIIWSPYPAVVCTIFGAMLIIIAICRPLRESLRKRFFL